jgi:hypothetical protein
MRLCLCLVALLAVCVSSARSDEPWLLFDGSHWEFPKWHSEWRPACCWCPNDYCRKALPCVQPNPHGCVDDYCRKALPCVPPNAHGCVDDYCRKTCPIFLGRICEPWYSCGQPQDGGAGTCPNCLSKP